MALGYTGPWGSGSGHRPGAAEEGTQICVGAAFKLGGWIGSRSFLEGRTLGKIARGNPKSLGLLQNVGFPAVAEGCDRP